MDLYFNEGVFTLTNISKDELTEMLDMIKSAHLPQRRTFYRLRTAIEKQLKALESC